jgi:hypothetical protein
MMRALGLLGTAAFLAALGGCAASASPQWDAAFGDRSRALSAQQVMDLEAPIRHAGASPSADGRTVHEAMERHVDSYRKPPPSNVINIGVGGGSAAR